MTDMRGVTGTGVMVAVVVTGGSSDGGDSGGERGQRTMTKIIQGLTNLPI